MLTQYPRNGLNLIINLTLTALPNSCLFPYASWSDNETPIFLTQSDVGSTVVMEVELYHFQSVYISTH